MNNNSLGFQAIIFKNCFVSACLWLYKIEQNQKKARENLIRMSDDDSLDTYWTDNSHQETYLRRICFSVLTA